MIRTISRPSTACCTLPLFVGFLLSEPSSLASCCRLGNLLNISHDSVNRFLNRENYGPQDLFDEVKEGLNLKGGVLRVDDSVLDKPYSNYIAYVAYFWSGKHHQSVRGINLITLYYTDPQGQHQPVNFRVYDKAEGKTKNDYFLETLKEVLAWGIEPSFVTGDSWYSCIKNLKSIKNHQAGFYFGLEANRLISVEKGSWIQVQTLDIPEDGLVVYLREFGQVKVFRTHLKNQMRHYAVYLPEPQNPDDSEQRWNSFGKTAFQALHDQHWQIEQYHRTIKQVCNKCAILNTSRFAIASLLKTIYFQQFVAMLNCSRCAQLI